MKLINIDSLKRREKRMLRDFLKVHYLFRYLQDIRTKYRKALEKSFLTFNFKESFKVLDEMNKIVTYFNYYEYDDKGEFNNITPKPYVEVKTEVKQVFKNKYKKPLKILNKLKN